MFDPLAHSALSACTYSLIYASQSIGTAQVGGFHPCFLYRDMYDVCSFYHCFLALETGLYVLRTWCHCFLSLMKTAAFILAHTALRSQRHFPAACSSRVRSLTLSSLQASWCSPYCHIIHSLCLSVCMFVHISSHVCSQVLFFRPQAFSHYFLYAFPIRVS